VLRAPVASNAHMPARSNLTATRQALLLRRQQRQHPSELRPVIYLDWSGVSLGAESTPYVEKAVELQDSNMALYLIYAINCKSQ
jgi:hypothetical protein